jgi:hypothetical protein
VLWNGGQTLSTVTRATVGRFPTCPSGTRRASLDRAGQAGTLPHGFRYTVTTVTRRMLFV